MVSSPGVCGQPLPLHQLSLNSVRNKSGKTHNYLEKLEQIFIKLTLLVHYGKQMPKKGVPHLH